ncbi:Aminomethyltransferase folate-binding domain-containing protein [Rhizodiscina lignyota]|uniref:Iron-sulfur cluster assembly factor IBA57 homolog, mitochondrial n=1 Tax=Rhizodiscina lignyota TaxID=1504668 RepID=A0A9P4MC17_9PEZI|nr:Aminomethyltransferase folate-binding domain-containing protein [Rhizodiscina lignyota]
MRGIIPRRPTLCTRCLLSLRRAYGTTLPPQPPRSGIARLTNRRLVSLHGPDAPKFLFGLTTNNLHPSWTSGWYSAFLTAQGRVLWDVFIYPTSCTGKGRDEGDWSCFIEVDAGEVESLVKHLKRHKLRSKVTIRAVDEGEWSVFAAWDDFARTLEALAQTGMPDSLTETDIPTYTLRRYLHGIPEGQAEILRESALPQESDIDFMNGIDFKKGCYVGQELTIRTHHTGVVRKRILPVQLYDASDAAPEELAYREDWAGGVALTGANIKKAQGKVRSAGKFLAGVGNVGLGLCRLEMMTDVQLTAEGGTYKPGDEFEVDAQEGEKRIRIKPFIPGWMKDRLQIREAPRRVE